MNQFSFMNEQPNGSIQWQSFNMNAVISTVYDTENKILIVLIKHKYKEAVPVSFKQNKGTSKETRLIDKDFEMLITRQADIKRFMTMTSHSWMTSEEIDSYLNPVSDVPVITTADN